MDKERANRAGIKKISGKWGKIGRKVEPCHAMLARRDSRTTKPFKQTTITGARSRHSGNSSKPKHKLKSGNKKMNPLLALRPCASSLQLSKCVEANIIGFVIEQKFPYIETVLCFYSPFFYFFFFFGFI